MGWTIVKLGDLKRAEEILKIASVPPKIYPSNELLNKRQDSWVIWGYALLFAARNSWKEANQYFEKSIETTKTLEEHTQASVRRDYACALNRQGRTEEAKEQLDEAQKLTGRGPEDILTELRKGLRLLA